MYEEIKKKIQFDVYGSELWWKIGRQAKGRANEIQKLVNQEARAVTGCFRTTNAGVLALEAGLRPAEAQLDNRQRRYGIRLSGLPEGDHAKKLVGANSAVGRRLSEAIGYTGRLEHVTLLPAPEILDATTMVEEETLAKAEAERPRRGLTMFTDGSHLDSGAAGYAVTWRKGTSWVGIKTHMGYNQEAYDAECAALARGLKEASLR